MRTSIARHVVTVLLCCLSISVSAQVTFVPPNAESSNLLTYVFNKKWGYKNQSCIWNGGFYKEFNKDSPTGQFTTISGVRNGGSTTKKIITEFKLLSDNSFSYTMTRYAEGSDSTGKNVHAVEAYIEHTYKLISNTRMDYMGSYSRVDREQTRLQKKPVYITEPENGFRLLCP